jgi:hypothetical protein
MRAVITGPRSTYRTRQDPNTFPYMHIELTLQQLPAPGEIIILNDGGSYVVERVMRWVDVPDDDSYWNHDADLSTSKGVLKAAHIDVLPSDWEPYGDHASGVELGRQVGSEDARAEVANLLDLAGAPDVDPASVLAMVRAWAQRGADAKAAREAEQAEKREIVRQVLARLQEKEELES